MDVGALGPGGRNDFRKVRRSTLERKKKGDFAERGILEDDVMREGKGRAWGASSLGMQPGAKKDAGSRGGVLKGGNRGFWNILQRRSERGHGGGENQ